MAPSLGRDEAGAGPIVQGFVDSRFRVENETYSALLLTPVAASHWQAPPLPELTIDALQPLLTLQPRPEFLLLGTGPSLRFPPRDLREALDASDMGVEVMDSRAAARIWGLLRGEGRWIAAALMPLA